jgi:hypothetical protein
MPAKCVSSVSPRFHYRRVAFCFLPLAAILESSLNYRIYTKMFFPFYDRLREEKVKEKQKHQEERLKAALERAVAQPKKKVCVCY